MSIDSLNQALNKFSHFHTTVKKENNRIFYEFKFNKTNKKVIFFAKLYKADKTSYIKSVKLGVGNTFTTAFNSWINQIKEHHDTNNSLINNILATIYGLNTTPIDLENEIKELISNNGMV